MPRVSVIMPVLNREKYLPSAIESVLGQSFVDWELILSDGGSRDASTDIMRGYAEQDGRVRFFSNPGTNIPENRNAALAMATGEYAAMLDSDDVARPDRLARQTAFLDNRPDIAAVGGNFDVIDDDGKRVETGKYAKRLTDPAELRRHMALGWHCFLQSSMMFRRNALTAVGGYRAIFRSAEEDDLYYRLYDSDCLLANLPDLVVSYRWHGDNACVPSVATQLHRVVALGAAYCRWNNKPDPVEERRQALDYPFLLDLFARLGDRGLVVRLFWIGVSQRYGVAEPDMFRAAWLDTLSLRMDAALASEVERHWITCREKYPDAAAEIGSRFDAAIGGTVSAFLAQSGEK